MCLEIIYLIYMYEEDLALNKQQGFDLPSNQTKPNHIYLIYIHKEDLALNNLSSSSSYRAGSTDIPDPLSPLLPIVHRPR